MIKRCVKCKYDNDGFKQWNNAVRRHNLDLDDLQIFTVLARKLNFRATAEEAGLSAPALTRLIARLEDRVGARLFDRTDAVPAAVHASGAGAGSSRSTATHSSSMDTPHRSTQTVVRAGRVAPK